MPSAFGCLKRTWTSFLFLGLLQWKSPNWMVLDKWKMIWWNLSGQ